VSYVSQTRILTILNLYCKYLEDTLVTIHSFRIYVNPTSYITYRTCTDLYLEKENSVERLILAVKHLNCKFYMLLWSARPLEVMNDS